ncbi:unnamed protein product [Rotaria sordida]|uniref:Uncharacterized protein n=1 Tax=Rotaria sordida TaxID=392033 RepID=A0A819JZU5_9BILA|nr:unnamed protein product [Rotaria sordida]
MIDASTDDLSPLVFHISGFLRTNNGQFQDHIVDDIKSLRRIISDTMFIVQGVHMKILLFIGLSDVFVSASSLEFAYSASSQAAQSLVMRLRFCSIGLTSFLDSVYINIYESVYENFTEANLECKDTRKSKLFYIYFFVLDASQHRVNTRLFIGTKSGTSNV